MIEFHAIRTGQGPILLFLHGFMGSSADWWPVMEHLQNDFCCIAVDLPGHGQTQVQDPQCFAMEQTAEHLVNWLQRQKIQPDLLMGYSMGGRLALYCALSFPQVFPQAVLESASPGLRKDEDRKARQIKDFQHSMAIENNFHNFLTIWYEQSLFVSLKRYPQAFDAMMQRRLKNSPQNLSCSLRKMGTGSQPNLWEKLTHHSHPLLLLAGELDPKYVDLNRTMVEQCPSAQLKIIANAGHNIHLENPAAIAHQLRRFLSC